MVTSDAAQGLHANGAHHPRQASEAMYRKQAQMQQGDSGYTPGEGGATLRLLCNENLVRLDSRRMMGDQMNVERFICVGDDGGGVGAKVDGNGHMNERSRTGRSLRRSRQKESEYKPLPPVYGTSNISVRHQCFQQSSHQPRWSCSSPGPNVRHPGTTQCCRRTQAAYARNSQPSPGSRLAARRRA